MPCALGDPEMRGTNFGRALHSIRFSFGLTQSELAKKLGSSQSSLARVEAGDLKPSALMVLRLFQFLLEDLPADSRPLSRRTLPR